MRRSVHVLVLACLAAGLAGCSVGFDGPSPDADSYDVTVTDVVDGDTVDVRFANGSTERVRLVGIDTPEVHVETEPADFEGVPDTDAGRACLRSVGETASTFVDDALEDGPARIELDPGGDTRGGYGRLLASLYVDGESLNYRLVTEGYATVYPTAFERRDDFEEAEDEAMRENRGAWRCRDAG